MKEFWKKYKGQLFATLILMILIAAAPFESYYQRSWTASDLEIPAETEDFAALTEDEEPVLEIREGAKSGAVAVVENVTLQKGTYRIQSVTLSKSSQNTLEIWSSRHLNGDNTEGKLLGEMSLASEGGLKEATFCVEDSLEDVSFRVLYGGTGNLNVSSLYLTSTGRMYRDPWILMGLVLLASLLVLLLRIKKGDPDRMGKRALLVLGAAVVLAAVPISFQYVLDGNDLYYQFNRILGIQEALKAGQFPVKLHSTFLHGYGYGSPIFYPELFLYIPAVFGCMGMSLIGCYRLLLLLVHMATAFVSYRSFSGLMHSREKGLMAACLYTLSVYRLIDLYTRAALGEGMAMIFLPLVMWGLYELILGDSGKWYLAALGFTGVMQCHILTTELSVVFGAAFGLMYIRKLKEKGRIPALLLAGGSTVLMNVGLVLPLLQHTAYPFKVFSVESTLSWWTVTLPKLFDLLLSNPTQRMYAGLENSGEMPCTIGFVLLLGILAFGYSWVMNPEKQKEDVSFRRYKTAFVLAVIGIYASTSYFPWDRVQSIGILNRLVSTVQFSWRCLAISTALLCPVCAEGVWRLSENRELRKGLCIGFGVLAVLCSAIYVNRYCEEAGPRYTSENAYQREKSQVDEMYFVNVPHSNSFRIWNRENTFTPSGGVMLSDCVRTEKPSAEFTYEKPEGMESAFVDVSLTWYPDYCAKLSDGTPLLTDVGDGGVLRIWLPENAAGSVKVYYREPGYVRLGKLISLLAFSGVCLMMGKRKKKDKTV